MKTFREFIEEARSGRLDPNSVLSNALRNAGIGQSPRAQARRELQARLRAEKQAAQQRTPTQSEKPSPENQ